MRRGDAEGRARFPLAAFKSNVIIVLTKLRCTFAGFCPSFSDDMIVSSTIMIYFPKSLVYAIIMIEAPTEHNLVA